jgi:hypothetical protein
VGTLTCRITVAATFTILGSTTTITDDSPKAQVQGIENFVRDANYLLNRTTGIKITSATDKQAYVPRIQVVWVEDPKTADIVLPFVSSRPGPGQYGLDDNSQLLTTYRMVIASAKVFAAEVEAFRKKGLLVALPSSIHLEKSRNVAVFLQQVLNIKPSPDDPWWSLLGDGTKPLAEAFMLPRYYTPFADVLNKEVPGGGYTVQPDLATKGATRRLLLNYIFGPAAFRQVTDAQLDKEEAELRAYLTKRYGKALEHFWEKIFHKGGSR